MAVIPLKQTVTVYRKGEADRWGNNPAQEEVFDLNCRISEGAKLVRGQTMTEEIISVARITFDKFADVRLTDELEYVDEAGDMHTYKPINIERVRGLNGKAMMTVVSV